MGKFSNLRVIQNGKRSIGNGKHCHKCNTTKYNFEFYKNRTNPDGLASQCSDCVKKAVSKWQKDNPEKNRAKERRRRHKRNDRKEYQRHFLHLKGSKPKLPCHWCSPL